MLRLFFSLAALYISCSGDKGGGPPDDPDVPSESLVRVGNVRTAAGNHTRIDIFAVVGEPMLGVKLPLGIANAGVNIDSVSFAGTLLRSKPAVSTVEIGQSGNSVSILRRYELSGIIEPDSGTLMSLHVTIDGALSSQAVKVDLAPGEFCFYDSLSLCTEPGFVPGLLHVVEKSVVWVDSVEATPGESVRLDVFAILRSPLQGLQLPLKLSGLDSAVDSVGISFAGTLLEKRPLLSYVGIDDTSSETQTTISIIRTYTPSAYIEPDSGVLLSIYLDLSESAGARTIAADTTTIERSSLRFADTADVGSVPFFTPGAVSIQAPAP